ncbi:hypothetical protein SAMN05216486_10739 [bacterium JGI 053]|nr:hypothetical protein SAMN05216486_10739 [bacterium JGI 053]
MMPNPDDPSWASPVAIRATFLRPDPAAVADRPASGAEGEALLARLEGAPAELDAASAGVEEHEALAVLRNAMLWESWLSYALDQLATGGRLAVGGNIRVHLDGPPSVASFRESLAALRSANVATARERGAHLWAQAADGLPRLTAHQVLASIAALDADRVALLREAA